MMMMRTVGKANISQPAFDSPIRVHVWPPSLLSSTHAVQYFPEQA